MKLLFLDVDGVLNYEDWGVRRGLVPVPAPYQPSVEDLVRWIDPERVELVNEIVERTGCRIILSSSTRSDPRMSVVLAQAGLKAPIYDTTPALLWKVNEAGSVVDVTTRADEVYDACRKHQPFTIAVLDDQDHDWERLAYRMVGTKTPEGILTRVVETFLVKTSFATGLLREHVDRAVWILEQPIHRQWAPLVNTDTW